MLFSWGQIWFDRLGPFKTFDFMKLCLKPGIRSLWSNKMNIRHKLDKIQIQNVAATFMIQACTQKLETFQARPHKLIKQHNDPCLIYSAKFQAFP